MSIWLTFIDAKLIKYLAIKFESPYMASALLMPQFCDDQDSSAVGGAQHIAQVVGGGPSLTHDHKQLHVD